MELKCYRCGAALNGLTLPLSRLDTCPGCGVELHVCRMCACYAPGRPDDCSEEDALEVRNKASANFCDYFRPTPDAFDGRELAAEGRARDELAALFSGPRDETEPSAADTGKSSDPDLEAANALFRK